MEDLKNAIQESLPDNVNPESLPDDVNKDVQPGSSQEAHEETPSPKVEQEKQVPFNEHPRWKEVMRERDRERERADRLQQQMVELAMRQQNPQTQTDPYAGMTPEEKVFWEKQRQIAREEAQRVAQEAGTTLRNELLENKILVTSMMYERFLEKHPDIQPDSEEAGQIAQKVKAGLSLEDAYTVVTYPRKLKEVQDSVHAKKTQQQTKKTTEKIAANLEGSGVASTSPFSSQAKELSNAEIVDLHFAGKL